MSGRGKTLLVAKAQAAEQNGSHYRLLLSLFCTVIMFVSFGGRELLSWQLVGLITFSTVYSASLWLLRPLERVQRLWFSYLCTLADWFIVFAWLTVSGGFDSPFLVLLFVAPLSAAFRYDALRTAAVAAWYGVSYVALMAALGALQLHPGEVLVRAVCVLLVGGIIAEVAKATMLHMAAERDLAAANVELRQLDEMKSRFVSSASHELRTPLTSIRAFAEFLTDDPTLDETQHEFAAAIEAESQRLSRIANNLLDLTRMESGRMPLQLQALDVHDLLERLVVGPRTLAADKGVDVVLDVPDSLPLVQADADRLHQVLVNLVDNALKFTEQGRIVIRAEECQGSVRLSVSDTGIGISPEEQPRIFERFYQSGDTLQATRTGAGLGLAICSAILDRHGSRLELESIPGRGSTFGFAIPTA